MPWSKRRVGLTLLIRTYPRVPGHEVAGVIDAAGPEVADWTAGDRLAIGWHGSHKRAL